MLSLHDPARRAALESRIRALTPDSARQWGRMTPDQMLRHINQALDINLGRIPVKIMFLPMPRAWVRYFALNFQWPKGSPTAPEMLARERYDFAAEQARCLAAVAETAAKPLASEWGLHPAFGKLSGEHATTLGAKHLDYHLRQFGV